MKAYNLSWREAVDGISYPNLLLLSAVIPSYDSATDKETTTLRADDPKNNERIKQLLHRNQ